MIFFQASSLGNTLLYIFIGFVLFSIAFWIFSCYVASIMIFKNTLRRNSKEQWSRNPSGLEGDSLKMDIEGQEWCRKHSDFKTDVHIVNDGLNLYGEYYDFGHHRCVIILSGRTESLRYGYYFAKPYSDNGFNVLVIDPRAHGLSDGEYNSFGFNESRDALAWTKYIHERFNISSVVYHGICIGAAAGMLAITSDGCPDYVDAIVTDGMFANFGESMKNHIIERKKPTFLVYELLNHRVKRLTGHSMNKGPIDVIDKLDKAILMLYSKEDPYSVPDYAKKLFDKAGTDQKKLVWFEHGAHSMLRITDTKRYDGAIAEFIQNVFQSKQSAMHDTKELI